MRFLNILVPFLVALATPSTFASPMGPGTSGGGDAIRCNDGKVYALDFVLTEGSGTIDSKLAALPTGESILSFMAERLKNKIPTLYTSLIDYKQFNDKPTASAKRLWLNRTNPLIYLNDQNIDQVPSECLDANHNPNVWQAVVRTSGQGAFILYQRDQNALVELSKNSAIQLSFMYLHEWLRDYTDDASVIRNVNRYLHSTGTLDASPEEIRAVLIGFGLRLGGVATSGEIASQRNHDIQFRKKMEQLANGCDSIGDPASRLQCLDKNLAAVEPIVIHNVGTRAEVVTAIRVMSVITRKSIAAIHDGGTR